MDSEDLQDKHREFTELINTALNDQSDPWNADFKNNLFEVAKLNLQIRKLLGY